MKIKRMGICILIIIIFVILLITVFTFKNNTKKTKDIKELRISGFQIQSEIIIEGNDKEIILDIIEKLNYNRRICAEINQYTIQLDNGTVYGIKESSKEILKGDKQAKISDKDLNTILNIIEKNKLKYIFNNDEKVLYKAL